MTGFTCRQSIVCVSQNTWLVSISIPRITDSRAQNVPPFLHHLWGKIPPLSITMQSHLQISPETLMRIQTEETDRNDHPGCDSPHGPGRISRSTLFSLEAIMAQDELPRQYSL